MVFTLKEAREKANLTQEQLAQKSGVGRITICRLETGELKETHTGTLVKLAQALDVSLNDLVRVS